MLHKKDHLITFLLLVCTLAVFGQEANRVEPAFGSLIEFDKMRDFTLSASGDEGYFTLQSPLEEVSVIARISKKNGEWVPPEMVSFSGKYKDLEPFLASDGLRLYFVSDRPLDNQGQAPKDFDIWYVTRETQQSPWGAPVNLGAPVNTEHNEFYPALADNNNLYFTTDSPLSKGKDDIFWSRWNGTAYTNPQPLSDSVNTGGFEYNAYIAPDESYLIFGGYNREDGYGSGDLYISYRSKDKKWSAARNLGPGINSVSMDYCPFIDQQNNILYFTSRRSNLKKVNSFSSLKEVMNTIGQYENGFSRIYKVSVQENKLFK